MYKEGTVILKHNQGLWDMRITQRKRVRKLLEQIHDAEYDLRDYAAMCEDAEILAHLELFDKHFTKMARLFRLELALSYSEEDV